MHHTLHKPVLYKQCNYNDITGASCAHGDLSLNSRCYRKFHNSSFWLSWYDASNFCLSRGGSLAVFTDIERLSNNKELTDWLTASGTDKTYWIGLIRSWWNTTTAGVFEFCYFGNDVLTAVKL